MAVIPPLVVTAALTAANMAINAMRKIEGPRLTDTMMTVADYGTPLNYLVGMRVVPCPAFFAKKIRMEKVERKGKGGKTAGYTGYGTWAAHVADHEIAGVTKIWFDNHLIFDASSGDEEIYPLGDDYSVEANMRIYTGTATQDPDPDMQAYIEARDGEGTCPAYRRQSYIYFDDIPLEMLGNRFPDVKALVRTLSRLPDEGWDHEWTFEVLDAAGTAPSLSFLQINYPGTGGVVEWTASPGGDLFSRTTTNPTGKAWKSVWKMDRDLPAGTYVVTWDPTNLPGSQTYRVYWRHRTMSSPVLLDEVVSSGAGAFDRNIELPAETEGDGHYDAGPETVATLEQLLDFVGERSGLDAGDYDWSAAADIEFVGYNWTQGTGKQILEPLLDLFDVDVRPHDFGLEALPRGSASAGAISSEDFAIDSEAPETPYTLTPVADRDLPWRVFLNYADASADHNPNVAMPSGPSPGDAGSRREGTLDVQTLALEPEHALRLAERWQRRRHFGRLTGEFALPRRHAVSLEPGDVHAPEFDGDAMTMRCTKLVSGADGRVTTEWERDDPAVAVLSGSAGAIAAGHIPDQVPNSVATVGAVLDLPLLVDAHDQSAPLAYLVAGPEEPGVWMGADFARSNTGELDSYEMGWDGIVSEGGSIIGECAAALPEALPWVPDMGSTVTVEINAGQLTAATLGELLADPTRNLAAVESAEGWELVQFMTPVLTGTRTYAITGFLRGVRGTEWAIGGHAAGDRFVLLDSAKRRTLGASEIGDTDWYIASPFGQIPDQDDAFSLAYTGASHKPLAPVLGSAEQDGADWLFDATRRTRLGGGSLDNQDVPLGQASESWSLDILDGSTVKRTIAGTSLPLTYAEADQITDFGSAQSSVSANLYQVDPTLNLRGYPLEISA